MDEIKVKAKKQFGQHFLTSQKAVNDLVNCLDNINIKIVIEIGPGTGILTKQLLEKGFVVLAIEIDKESIKYLEENFTEYIKNNKLIIIEKDFLELDTDKFLDKNFKKNIKYYLVGNIPYYITGLIFRKTFQVKNLPEKVVYLVQKEVAERVVAKDKKESILSLSIKYFGSPKIISIVKAGSFNPAPKVDSAILEIANIKENPQNEELFFKIIKIAFLHKRKTALSNLKKYLFNNSGKKLNKKEANFPSENLPQHIKTNLLKHISEKERAEDIPLSTWLKVLN